jgi:exodeoxyribonuclease-3
VKIVTWNCNGGFRKKLRDADSLGADLLLIQECENPAFHPGHYQTWAGDYLWAGTDKNRGIGVFPRNGARISALDWQGKFSISGFERPHQSQSWSTADLKLFLPFKVNDTLTILGVWTKGSNSEAFGYIGQFWKYLQIHDSELAHPGTMIIGDFNSNAIWDKPDRWWSHSTVVAELAQLNIHSLYHHSSGELQGSESEPTFYLHRNRQKPYHIDFAFVSGDLLSSSSIAVGKAADWLHVSDHMPVIVMVNQ